jgi:hypothetical protein
MVESDDIDISDLCAIDDDDQRNCIWRAYYFEKWGHFPDKRMQSYYEAFCGNPTVINLG